MRMNEFEYVRAKDAVSTVPDLEPSDADNILQDDNSRYRIDMMLVIHSRPTPTNVDADVGG